MVQLLPPRSPRDHEAVGLVLRTSSRPQDCGGLKMPGHNWRVKTGAANTSRLAQSLEIWRTGGGKVEILPGCMCVCTSPCLLFWAQCHIFCQPFGSSFPASGLAGRVGMHCVIKLAKGSVCFPGISQLYFRETLN